MKTMKTGVSKLFLKLTAYSLRLIVFLLFTIHYSLFTEVHAQESQTVNSDGIAPIIGDNKAIARDNAINDALRKAVEQAVGTMVSSETVVQNFQLLSDRIYSQTQGYIQSYKVLSEGAPEPMIYKVTIQAVVSTGNLKNDLAALGLLMAKKGMPRVLFMIAEQNIGQTHFVYWWGYWGGAKAGAIADVSEMNVAEHALTEKFLEKGFNIVDHSVQAKNIQMSPSFGVVDLTDKAVKTIAGQLDAEVVIYGKASAKLAGSVMGSGILSSQANINAKAVRVDTGGVIASASASGAAVHSDEVTAGNKALEKVSSDLAEKLVEQISKKWGQEVAGSTLVQMVISGVGKYGDFVKFKNAVQSKVRGVQAIHQRSISGGTAVADIDIKGSAQSLADEIAMLDFKEFDVDVTNVTSNRVELTISPKGEAPKAPPQPPVPAPKPEAEGMVQTQVAEDRHWIQADDYFISERPYEQGWIYVGLAKLKQPATPKSKGEAKFFRLRDSKEVWTKHFWKSRPAEEADLQIGALVICFEGNSRDGVYQAPENKKEARGENWFMGRITDTSDLYKGSVQVSNYSCSPQAIRAPFQ